MTEDELAKAMLADAQEVAARQNKKFGTKINIMMQKKKKITKKALTRGDGWRNDKLKVSEIKDIVYFLERGWCIGSTAIICGVSKTSVHNIKKQMS